MRRLTITVLSLLCSIIVLAGPVSEEAFNKWHSSKYSMFIHFGLYSELGGVWNGHKVTNGYSEQIQSHGGIFSDDYAEVAEYFNPEKFNADEIVTLAKAAGMRSIVFTTKHHDGFCMWKTATTDFNSWDATPQQRDFVKELSESCKKGGLRFGLYFSLIDWHYPYGYPISSSNADFVTPEHHKYNVRQVTELLSNYGPISELWFDMGSLEPAQSKDLYSLVHRLQPDCMVSGRLGNDQYDFCVMGDNSFPDGTLKTAWQTPASMFSETWGYRSWQERGSSHVKAAEKLRALLGVVSHGGNYLLNIGPKGDGSVVDFERDVLLEVGEWLETNGEAVYGADAFAWPGLKNDIYTTIKGNSVYVFPSSVESDKVISIPLQGTKLISTSILGGKGKPITSVKGGVLSLTVPATSKDELMDVICLTFDRPLKEPSSDVLKHTSGTLVLNNENAEQENSYSCFDYYTNYQSVIAYDWTFSGASGNALQIEYPKEYLSKEIALSVDGRQYSAVLSDVTSKSLSGATLTWSPTVYSIQRGSWSRNLPSKVYDLENASMKWSIAKDEMIRTSSSMVYVAKDVQADADCDVVMEFAAGNGVEVLVNGQSILKHLNPYRTVSRHETVIVHLKKGRNQILVGSYNRFEKNVPVYLEPAQDNTVYSVVVPLDQTLRKSASHKVRVSLAHPLNDHTDIELSNMAISIISR